ncbi:MAG: multicopper oxidase domain-containing protein [Rhodobacter sp.]|nr:multicopper oxidase domain-containing protein [Rhodobacter sp.]
MSSSVLNSNEIHGSIRPAAMTRRALLQTAGAGALASGAAFGLAPAAMAQPHPAYRLEVQKAVVDVPGVELRTYNGLVPGPTLRVDPGGDLDVILVNNLEPEPPDQFCPPIMNAFHAANTTNFHTHGLHVSPEKSADGNYDSDNVFLNVTPKAQEVPDNPHCANDDLRRGGTWYKFELPEYHPSGTFWYHAHKHGSTARQVGNGLSGPLIVNDPPGFMPSYIENAREDVFMIQLRDLTEDSSSPSKSIADLMLVLAAPEGGGFKSPTIVMRPGEVRRWRFINAAPRSDGFISLNVASDDPIKPELWQIAFDGITLKKRVRVNPANRGDPWDNHAALAPGNRTDFMVRIPRDSPEGELRLMALQPALNQLHEVSEPTANELEMTIRVTGDPVDDEWSDSDELPDPGPLLRPISPSEIVRDRDIVFNLDSSSGTSRFMINDMEFDGEVKKSFKLGTAERWQLQNVNDFTHPFHIHVNPFFVTHIRGKELAEDDPRRRWQDTIALPTGNADRVGEVTVLSRFVKFTGAFVIHCHILSHEDLGMMQKVEVIA